MKVNQQSPAAAALLHTTTVTQRLQCGYLYVYSAAAEYLAHNETTHSVTSRPYPAELGILLKQPYLQIIAREGNGPKHKTKVNIASSPSLASSSSSSSSSRQTDRQ